VEKHSWLPAGSLKEESSLSVSFGDAPEEDEDGVEWPSREVCKDVQKSIHDAWTKGKPLSPYPQTINEGRYAIRNISADHGLKPAVVKMMLEAWLRTEMLSLELADSHSKMKGLRVTKWVD